MGIHNPILAQQSIRDCLKLYNQSYMILVFALSNKAVLSMVSIIKSIISLTGTAIDYNRLLVLIKIIVIITHSFFDKNKSKGDILCTAL